LIEHDLFGTPFARRSCEPHERTVPGLRAGENPLYAFPDYAL
jgi:hypothetical protein